MLVFGDSIAWGAWDREGGWVARLQKEANSTTVETNFEKYQAVYNLSISGDKSDLLLERFEQELRLRLNEEGECLEIVFAVGINDSLYSAATDKFWTDPEDYKENILSLIKTARKYSKKIVFAGLTPVDETKVDPVPWVPGESYKNEYIKKFDDILKNVCSETGIVFIPLFEKMFEADYKKLLEDGVHPNTQGHALMYKIIKEALVKEGMM